MENPEAAQQANLEQMKQNLLDKLDNFLDQMLQTAGLIAETAVEIFSNLVPSVIPWPPFNTIKSFLPQILQFRQHHPSAQTANPHIPHPFSFIHKGKVRQNIPHQYRLQLKLN